VRCSGTLHSMSRGFVIPLVNVPLLETCKMSKTFTFMYYYSKTLFSNSNSSRTVAVKAISIQYNSSF
jgi:hypothetical protein